MTTDPKTTVQVRLLTLGFAIAAGTFVATPAEAMQLRTDVVVDVTPAGRSVPRPTPDRPAYYMAVPGGYKALGGVARRQVAPPPPEAEVDAIFARALAQQGYLQASKQNPPSLIITYSWGSLIPILVGRGKAATIANQAEMASMLAGDKVDSYTVNLPPPWPAEVLTDERRPQRFLKISAFDYGAWQAHRTVLLWQAHITIPGLGLASIMPTLIAAAAPALGIDSGNPIFDTVAFVPPGNVLVGPPKEK